MGIKNREVQCEQIKIGEKELEIFVETMNESIEIWIQIIVKSAIRNETEIIAINGVQAIQKIYEWMIENINKRTQNLFIYDTLVTGRVSGSTNQNRVDFEKKYINKQCKIRLKQIIKKQGKILQTIFTQTSGQINRSFSQINTIITNKQLVNNYIIFGILKQMVHHINNNINNSIKKRFSNVCKNKIMAFSQFIFKYCQIFKLVIDYQNHNNIAEQQSPNQKQVQFKQNIQKQQIQPSKYQTNDFQDLLLIQKNQNQWDKKTIQSDSTKQESNDGIKTQNINSSEKKMPQKLIKKNMRMLEQNNTINDVCDSLESQIQFSGNTASYILPTDQYATIGGNIGKCLADINQFRNANQFFLELSKTTAICGTIGYAVTKIPMLTYFILAGGFSYSYYLTLSNQFLSPFKKVNQIGCSTMTALGTIGSTMSGIFIGQIAIPVPILGAFVGGVCGGYFGTKTMRKINSFLSKTNFRDIIMYLKKTILTDRHWLCTNNLIQKIGISESHLNTLANTKQQKDIYITAICFIIISFYQSNRHFEFNQQKRQQMNLAKTQHEKFFIAQRIFKNQFNIVKIIEYLIENNFSILNKISELKGFISHLIY